MSNALRGEGEIGGKAFAVNFNKLCELEQKTGYRVPDLLQLAGAGLGFDELRTWIGVLLIEPMEQAAVGDLIESALADAEGDTFDKRFQAVAGRVSAAFEGFFAPKKDAPANPRKAK